jgi:carbamoyl-phosphate synthase large subunit
MLTGAGGAAAISFIKAVRNEPVDIYAADSDACAAGLYLVPAQRRHLVPAGANPSFVPHVLEYCRAHSIDVLVPTVDAELLGVAEARDEFAAAGVTLLLASKETLAVCLDKLCLLNACEGTVPVGRHAALDATLSVAGWKFPLIVKPRVGSGSRGIQVVRSRDALDQLGRNDHLLLQEYLPGEEYSVDVLARSDGRVIAAVPRLRMKIDSGIAVTARTLHDPQLEKLARRVAERIGLTYTANIQFRRDTQGTPVLLEVNARFPGTMPLTVRSGVNMPLISLRDALGQRPGDAEMAFEDIAVVRYWAEEFICPDEIAALQRERA